MKRFLIALVVFLTMVSLGNNYQYADNGNPNFWQANSGSSMAQGGKGKLSAEYVPGEVIVKFKSETGAQARHKSKDEVETETSRIGVKSKHKETFSFIRAHHMELADKNMSVEDAIAQLQKDPDVEYAEPNYILHTCLTPNDIYYSQLWGLNNTGQTGGTADADIDAPEAWDLQTGDPNEVIGVIDTGIDYNHSDLAANTWTNPGEIAGNGIDDDGNGYIDDIHGINAITNSGNPMDDNAHGTHTSGTIGGVGNNGVGVAGVNHNVKIMGLKFLSASGSGSIADAVECVNYAIMMKNRGVNIRVLSNSWGGGGYSSTLYNAIVSAGNNNILFICAAGNNAANNDVTAFYPASYFLGNMIVVAATDSNDNLASFSNYGAAKVHLSAPGVGIVSTVPNNGYASYSGTSMATPHVSGVAGLIIASNPALTYLEVKNLILNNVDAKASLTGKTLTGGRLNAFKAINSIRVNNPPILASPGNQNIAENQLLTFTLSATDPDSDPIVFSAVGLPAGAALNASTGVFAWTPNYSQSGSYPVTFRATDSGGLYNEQMISIDVSNVDRPPVLASPGDKATNENKLLSFALSATDPDGDAISYSMDPALTGAALNSTTGAFTWTPAVGQAWTYTVTFTAAANLLSDSKTITIIVNPAVVNNPPVLNSIGNKSVTAGALLSFTISATDPNNDPLTYSAANLPSGASFNPSTRTFSWTPTTGQVGTYPNVLFSVTDGSLSDQETITIIVNPALVKPTATTGSATNITTSAARLNATVNPNGLATTFYFQWGTTTSYGNTTAVQSIGSGTTTVSVLANLTGLTRNKKYYYRIVAVNAAGTTYGSSKNFTTKNR